MNWFYKNSDYSKNHQTDCIVYCFEDGQIVCITIESFLTENPHLGRADFERWKRWSDRNFKGLLNQDRSEGRNHLPLHGKVAYTHPDLASADWAQRLEDTQDLRRMLDSLLTVHEARRLTLHYFYGYSIVEIARQEDVHKSVISRSISNAAKKIKNFLRQ